MMQSPKEIYDISVSLGDEAIDWPGNPPYNRELISRIADGAYCDLSQITMTTHVGTHVDTPAHFIASGKNLDEYPVERWIRPAHVVSIEDKEVISPEELKGLDIAPGDALLFKTANSSSGRSTSGVFEDDFVYISPEAARFCVAKKVGLVGIDYGSVDRRSGHDFPSHYELLGNGILILEGITLKDVPAGRYTIFCLPMKVKGAEGAPARAVLVR
ncbi:MAG: cyclase family protein [Dehalococcoidales bacterium]|nr:cyclase family protein [Dehalococcoidales bacterium]